MLTVPRLVTLMSEGLALPARRLVHVARRLGEADLLPRAGRGASPPPVDSADAVRLLMAAMSLGDGIDGTAARIVQAVQGTGRLQGEVLRVGEAGAAGGRRLAPAGSFPQALVAIVDGSRRNDTAEPGGAEREGPDKAVAWVRDFGLCFQGEGARPGFAPASRAAEGPRPFAPTGSRGPATGAAWARSALSRA